nr:hypothetical protein [uncultured bacterium]
MQGLQSIRSSRFSNSTRSTTSISLFKICSWISANIFSNRSSIKPYSYVYINSQKSSILLQEEISN